MNKKNYYKQLDIIRIISCIAVLLYHLNILKGGFLAVCIFFTLSGYLSCLSSLQKENFSLIKYYLNRIKKLYIPLLITIFTTLSILSLFPNINWLNLKPETTSVLLGYNNFWQLNANLDYFTKHISSPFMHMWYISILLQIELIFPILFIILNKLKEKTNKILPALITLILSILSYIYFSNTITNNIMIAYYHTLGRVFSYLLGLSFAFITIDYKPILLEKKYKIVLRNLIFYSYILILSIMFFLINSKSSHLEIYMLLSTIITIRLIKYTIKNNSKTTNIIDKIIKSISNITYEIYLTQYPIIFIFQNIKLNNNLKIFTIITLTIICSYILHISLNIKNKKRKPIRIILCILISLISIYGAYQYIITEDHTKEMKELEEKINKNKELTKQKQEEYKNKLKEEQDKWQLELDSFTNKEEELKEKVKNLRVVGIGDSVMLGAANALYKQFPNGYFDGKVNRTEPEAIDIIKELENKGLISDILIFNLGTNGECASNCKKRIMDSVGNRQVFWVNATNPDFDTCNPNIEKAAETYPNIHIVDWASVVKEHPEYVASDRTHVGGYGAKIYSETIYNEIYKYYLKEINKLKEEKIKEHENIEQNKITFFGNDLLLNIYEYIQEDYQSSEFIIESNLTSKTLIEELEKRKEENTLTNNLVFLLDNTIFLTKEELQTIINICQNKNITIITTTNIPKEENITIIDLSITIKKHKNYLSPDKIHLTEEGNLALKNIIKKALNEKEN